VGKTSSMVKRKYNEKAYDRISITVPKGIKEVLKNKLNGKSINSFINECIEKKLEDTK